LFERFLKTVLQMTTPAAEVVDNINASSIEQSNRGPLVFMHLPKCAGTSMVSSLLEVTVPDMLIRSGLDPCLFGTFTDFDSLDDQVRQTLFRGKSSESANYEFVSGHVAYSTLKQHFPRARFMTVLRRPASRLLSHFFYWRSLSEDALRPWGSFAERIRLSHGSLSEFLSAREIACQTDNLLTRFLV
jgi:hypothetical protein